MPRHKKTILEPPRLKKDWRNILKKAWSIRFIAAAGFFSGVETVVTFFPEAIPLPQFYLAVLAFVCTVLALASRILAQRNLLT